MKLRNKAIPASYLILEKEGKILIARRCNTGYQDGVYQTPAGHVDEGELPSQALIREAKEEVGIDIDQRDVELIYISYRPKYDDTDNRVDFFFRVKKWKGEVINAEPHKCDDLKWVSPNELPQNMTLHVRKGIEAMTRGIQYEEITLDELKAAGLYTLK